MSTDGTHLSEPAFRSGGYLSAPTAAYSPVPPLYYRSKPSFRPLRHPSTHPLHPRRVSMQGRCSPAYKTGRCGTRVAWAASIRRPDTVARALYPRQSAGVCTYNTCPGGDMAGYTLQQSTSAGNTLTCRYYFGSCVYDNTSGALTTDTDEGLCQPMSNAGGCARRRAQYKREDNFTAAKRRADTRREAARRVAEEFAASSTA